VKISLYHARIIDELPTENAIEPKFNKFFEPIVVILIGKNRPVDGKRYFSKRWERSR
jgi:hypothetical protein